MKVLKEISNMFDEMIAESFVDHFGLWELNCYNSLDQGMGTCTCFNHPTFILSDSPMLINRVSGDVQSEQDWILDWNHLDEGNETLEEFLSDLIPVNWDDARQEFVVN